MKSQIVLNGGSIKDMCQVTRIDPGEVMTSVRCRNHHEEFVAESVVIAAGPWTSKVLRKVGMDVKITTTYGAQVYFPLAKGPESTSALRSISMWHYDKKKSFQAWTHPSYEYPGLVQVTNDKYCARKQVEHNQNVPLFYNFFY
jgi:glycine/D-amino acid oxidase-like deaminating enzyme